MPTLAQNAKGEKRGAKCEKSVAKYLAIHFHFSHFAVVFAYFAIVFTYFAIVFAYFAIVFAYFAIVFAYFAIVFAYFMISFVASLRKRRRRVQRHYIQNLAFQASYVYESSEDIFEKMLEIF